MAFLLVIYTPLLLRAQLNKTNVNLYNVTQFGWLMGDNQHTCNIETINGITYKKYSAGLGVAFDKYGYESVPVFADLRYNLVTTPKTALQVYSDAGVNLPLHTDYLPHTYSNGAAWHTLHPSFYGEAGISWKASLVQRFSFIAGLGFNYKTFKYTEITYADDSNSTQFDSDYTFHYSKYVLRVGFGF